MSIQTIKIYIRDKVRKIVKKINKIPTYSFGREVETTIFQSMDTIFIDQSDFDMEKAINYAIAYRAKHIRFVADNVALANSQAAVLLERGFRVTIEISQKALEDNSIAERVISHKSFCLVVSVDVEHGYFNNHNVFTKLNSKFGSETTKGVWTANVKDFRKVGLMQQLFTSWESYNRKELE